MPSDPAQPPGVPPPPAAPPPGAVPAGPPPAPGTPPEAAAFAAPRRLHPTSVLLGVNLRQLVQAFLFPAAASFAAGGRIMLGVLVLVGVIGLVVRTLAWQRFSYSFDGEVLRVDEGVLSRNHRALDVARIQQVEVDRSALQRMLGLAALRVETAGSSSEVEVELRVVPEAEAYALRDAVRASKLRSARTTGRVGEPGAAPARRELLTVPLRHVVLASVTGVRLLVFPAVIAGAFQFAGQNLGAWVEQGVERMAEGVLTGPDGLTAPTLVATLVLAGGVLVLSVITAVVVGVLRDARFRIEMVDEDLHVVRGLLSTRDSVLPLRRIQLVQVRRNWLRRLLGYAAVRIHSAGGSGDSERRVTVPLLPGTRVADLISEVYPGVDGIPTLTPHPRNARRRAVFRWLRGAATPVAAVWLLPVGWLEPFELPVLALLPIAVALAVVEHRQLGHAATDRIVASRRGALSVTTSLAPLTKVQAVSLRANPFQRRLRLATVRAHVAGPGGDVEVLDADRTDADALHAVLTDHAAAPSLTTPTA